MAERVSYQNVESLVLQQSLCALTTAIIADLTQVASRLFEKHVISRAELRRAQLSTRPIDERANELVTQVLDQVKLNPEKFDAFMNALQESDVQQSVIRDVQDKYKDQKTKVYITNLIIIAIQGHIQKLWEGWSRDRKTA